MNLDDPAVVDVGYGPDIRRQHVDAPDLQWRIPSRDIHGDGAAVTTKALRHDQGYAARPLRTGIEGFVPMGTREKKVQYQKNSHCGHCPGGADPVRTEKSAPVIVICGLSLLICATDERASTMPPILDSPKVVHLKNIP